MLCFLKKSTYLIAFLYSLLFVRVSGRFEVFLGELALQNGLRRGQTTKNTTRQ